MRICPNCGATNSEADSNVCRKCGALLPLSNHPPRMRISLGRKKEKQSIQETDSTVKEHIDNKKTTNAPIPGEIKFFNASKQEKPSKKEDDLRLSEIPLNIEDMEQSDYFKPSSESQKTSDISSPLPSEENGIKEYFREVTPKPFDSPLIIKKGVYGSVKKQEPKQIMEENLKPNATKRENHSLDQDKTIKKQDEVIKNQENLKGVKKSELPPIKIKVQPIKREKTQTSQTTGNTKSEELVNDMLDVLSDLSNKLEIPEKRQESKIIKEVSITEKKEIPPTSLNDVLQKLMELDLHIEAAAIIKEDGNILASAISSMISDSLFATIGKNLSSIGNDIIEWLDADPLLNISIRGKNGILDLAPIDKNIPELQDLVLVIFSHPKAKSGIINLAISIVRKQVIEYLGLKK